MRLKSITLTASTLTALTVLGGCVPQAQYDDLMSAYRSKEQQLLQLQNEFDTSRANEEALRKQLAEAAADLEAAKKLVGGDADALDALQKRYEALLAQVNSFSTPLPESVNDALRDLADRSGGLLTFDERTGMVRFASDVTFDSGSAKLTSKASSVLKEFAKILNSADASNLEVRVVGHTDTVRIAKPETAAQHPTNIHLSAHRAISVRSALVGDGVGANRFMVAGYGEFRPIATNTARGAQENRRVEVFLAPMPAGALASSEATPTATKAPTRVATPEASKATAEPENFK
jgi:chemotaxis protein MotB